MTEDISIINLQEVISYLDGLTEQTFEIAKSEISAALLRADESIKTDTDLKRRTGNLFKSLQVRVEGNNFSNLKASIYTTSVYAPVHEYGATIRAKNAYKNVPGGPYLNIPMAANKTPAGVTRKTARQVFNSGGKIGELRSGGIGLLINNVEYFRFARQVTIPPRLKMVEKTEAEVPTMLSNIANRIGEN